MSVEEFKKRFAPPARATAPPPEPQVPRASGQVAARGNPEPWFYALLGRFGYVLVGVAALVCVLGASMAILVIQHEGTTAQLIVIIITSCAGVFLALVCAIAFLLVLVDVARNVRALRRWIEKEEDNT
jgi:hypothetical protein